MMRQRLRTRTSRLALLGRVVTVIFALALIWYGLMVLLLAAGVSADTVDAVSGYRTVFDELSSITTADVDDGVTRAIVAGAGLLAFVLFGYLALKELPRPYLTRSDIELSADERGLTTVGARTVERAAEIAARAHPDVSSASGRYGTDDLEVSISVQRARGVPEVLRDVHGRVRDALSEHGLPAVPVNVNLTGYDRRTRRELN